MFFTVEIIYSNPLKPNKYEPFYDYAKKVFINVFHINDDDVKIQIGKGKISLLMLDDAYMNDVDIYSVLDQDEYIFRTFESIIDFEELLFLFLDSPEEIENCILLEELKIKSEFQGLGIGKMVIEQIKMLFKRNFRYILTEVYPLQFSVKYRENKDHIDVYHSKHPKISKAKAFKKLSERYLKMGFSESVLNKNILYIDLE